MDRRSAIPLAPLNLSPRLNLSLALDSKVSRISGNWLLSTPFLIKVPAQKAQM